MAVFGIIDQFNLKSGEFKEYLERAEQYFVANDIDEDKKKIAVFITRYRGGNVWSFKKFTGSGKTYKEVSDALLNHLNPKPIAIVFIPGIRKFAET